MRQHIVDELEGDWLLIGGALVALWLDEARATEDVDIVGLTDPTEQRFTLLDVAERFGLPARPATLVVEPRRSYAANGAPSSSAPRRCLMSALVLRERYAPGG